MGAHIMRSHIDRQFVQEVEKEFQRTYPFLKIEFANGKDKADVPAYEGPDENILRSRARHLLLNEVQMHDDMQVSQLEAALQTVFDHPVQVFRKSGKFWIGTRMTRNWTLKQQNDQGRELI
jgi:hypothetical protein